MKIDRRDFLKSSRTFLVMTSAAATAWDHVLAGTPENSPNYRLTDHWWAMAIDIDKCIGCGNCVRACKDENDVPKEPYCFRTWVERYYIPDRDITQRRAEDHPVVDSPNGGYDGFQEDYRRGDGSKNFFVPKLWP